jgi:hypothetical protein
MEMNHSKMPEFRSYPFRGINLVRIIVFFDSHDVVLVLGGFTSRKTQSDRANVKPRDKFVEIATSKQAVPVSDNLLVTIT